MKKNYNIDDGTLKDRVESMVVGLKSGKAILKAIEKSGLVYEDVSEESGYFNIHIPTDDGAYVRIYKAKRGFVVQRFTWVRFKWSGIPVFEPSGRHSF